ncbi:uncharacterized protein LY89DRAFT_776168 [Mollisia scopiformis]|uniref:Uncharacterized protein n=1 Tax=Mollisia scopiformis TaxID=149040 RepID=A0A194XW61_MOLSC|nr:uncharacterized protein LY89DRAFT_776168 [Mollisia scopiformis]KUJ23962.1 hypothetical protein LY89DRAFT_776168 [Mollisia scopiformis]
MAIYAQKRAYGSPLLLGTSMVDLLAAPNENDEATLAFVRTWFGNVVSAATIPSPGGILIHCSDAHLIPTNPTSRQYLDNRGNTVINAPSPPPGISLTANACGGFAKGFTYQAAANQIIILCSDSGKGALISSFTPSLDNYRTSGDLRIGPGVSENGLDILGMWLSTVILHELMHAASFAQQLGTFQLGQFPATLPDMVNGATVGEIYQFTPISGKQLGASTSTGQSTANNLQHNADSFALLAASWYLPPYAWVNGQCRKISAINQAPLVYTNTLPPPGQS